MAKEIICNNGKVVLVDDDWYEELSKYRWSIRGGYAVTSIDGVVESMQRVIFGGELIDGYDIHHHNGNKFDNRRGNLSQMPHRIHCFVHHKIPNRRPIMF